MKENFKFHIIGPVVTLVSLITSGVFIYKLAASSILTVNLVIVTAAVFLVLCGGVFLLTFDSRKRVRTVIGCVIAAVIIALQIAGSYYIHIGTKALEEITDPETEYSDIGVYVKAEDPAQSLADTKDYIFGILEIQDRAVTDQALNKISAELNCQLTLREYAGVEELISALLDTGEVNAIVLNKSFLDLLEDVEGYEDSLLKIREIYSVSIDDDTVPAEPTEPEETEEPSDEVFTVYFSGIDCSGRISRRSRSDVNIIATVNVTTGQMLLVSTPRDYYVPLSISNGIPDKLTHAGIYGINVSRDTLEMLYDTEIDYYFRVNFDGFKEIIDALGGITVVSDYTFANFQKGENFVNGEQALSFARNRKSVPGGDRQRGKHQMAVIKGVIQKATGPALLTNYQQILNGLTGSFETDMPYERLTALIQNQLTNRTAWNIVSYSVNGTGDSKKPYSLSQRAYVMIPDQSTVDRARELMQQVKNGEIPKP